MIPLAGCTSASASMIKLRLVDRTVHLSTRALLAAREISHVDLLYRHDALLLRFSLEVPRQAIDSGRFVLGVPLELVVVLVALVMIKHGVSAAIVFLTCKHDPLSAETPLHPKLFGLTFDQVNHVVAEEHFSLGISILEELLRCDLCLVPEMVYLCVSKTDEMKMTERRYLQEHSWRS